MPRAFLERFAPGDWKGPRAKLFPARADAFQQLVGDALREALPGLVQVMPTGGRDGSIDAYLENGAALPLLFQFLPGPIIVECKDNDDSRGRVRDNVKAAWKKVETELFKHASAGWPTPYEPWRRARSYVYVTSAVLSNESMREDLERDVVKFFAKLKTAGQAQIEQSVVLDWSNLRPFLDGLSRIADRWLGVGLPALLGHDEHVATLTGVRSYLLPAELTFIPPRGDHEAHPDRLFAQVLERAQMGGVLLVGPGGAGKTRTLMEVAARFVEKGWRVLHALPGEPALKDEDLAETVLQGRSNTLLICDYLDQLQIDIGSLKERLLPAAARRGIRLAVVASARTERVLGDPVREAFFAVAKLPADDEQKQRIREEIRSRVAPKATEMLGSTRIDELVGARPIIALFILRELERRAHLAALQESDLASVRHGDLLPWLRKRLHEDKLHVRPPESPFDPDDPEPRVISVAAVLAAAPDRKEHLIGVAGEVLGRRIPLEKSAPLARNTVLGLLELGWLDSRERELAVAHDVVADELLTRVLRRQPGYELRREVLEDVLAPARHSPRTLGRLARSLGRLLAGSGQFEIMLRQAAEVWFASRAAELGTMLATADDVDETSYALGTLIEGPPWAGAIETHWAQAAEPWFAKHGVRPGALYLLFEGLRNNSEVGCRFIGPAFAWLKQNGAQSESRFVLAVLLMRGDLDREASARAISVAVDWLNVHAQNQEAEVVLTRLLARRDLDKEVRTRAISAAVDWLNVHAQAQEAPSLLSTLLGREDLQEDASRRTVEAAVAWLEQHAQAQEAGPVLAPLLLRGDLDRDATRATTVAFDWLKLHLQTPVAYLVLRTLILRGNLDRLDKKALSLTTSAAFDWLKVYGQTQKAGFFLHKLLRGDLDKDASPRAVPLAFDWLEIHPQAQEGSLVLHMLLGHVDLDKDASSRAASMAFDWLKVHPQTQDARFVLAPLLERGDLNKDASTRAVSVAFGWLEVHPQIQEAEVVLRKLLGRGDLDKDARTRAISVTFDWLEVHAQTQQAGFVLNILLGHVDLDKDANSRAVAAAFAWLKAHAQTQEARLVLVPLLGRGDLDKDASRRAVSVAFGWLEVHPQTQEAGFVLCPLLGRGDLDKNASLRAVSVAFGWLEVHPQTQEASRVLAPLLGRGDLDKDASSRAVSVCFSWLKLHPQTQEAGFVLVPLLWRSDLDKGTSTRAVSVAFNWLKVHAQTQGAGLVLASLLGRGDLDKDGSTRAASVAFEWLDVHPQTQEAEFIRRTLLERG